jgi:hypothetical protein
MKHPAVFRVIAQRCSYLRVTIEGKPHTHFVTLGSRARARARHGPLDAVALLQRFWRDMFHSLLVWPTHRLLLVSLACYYGAFFAFATLYYAFTRQVCIADIVTFLDALYFSIQTMMTIGYSTRDVGFEGCWLPAMLISSQALVGVALSTFFFGVLFARFARSSRRAGKCS